jgi:predicted phage terminase large subunit-like protein
MQSNASAKNSRTSRRSSSARSLPSLAALAGAKLIALKKTTEAKAVQAVKSYTPYPPHPKQAKFLSLDHVLELLYGGAAGGGKSDAMLMGALRYVHVPDYSAIIFRRTLTDLLLPDAILARAKTWWEGTPARWNEAESCFVFPTQPKKPPARIFFSYLATERDKLRYQGARFDYVGFEELTQFTETQYTYLFSRLRRRKGSTVPLRMRGTTNPGGPGHEWVKRRFVTHGVAVDADHLVNPPSAQELELARRFGREAQGAHFLKAFARDNPSLDLEEYAITLSRMDPVTRAQLEEGNWDAVPGGEFFKDEYFSYLEAQPAGAILWVRYWDLAATEPHEGNKDPDWTAGALVGLRRLEALRDAKGKVIGFGVEVIIADVVRDRREPGGVEALIKATAQKDGKRIPIVLEQEPGSSGKNTITHYQKNVLMGWSVSGDKKTGDKAERWKPLSAQGSARNLFLVRAPWNADFIAELKALPNGGHDDQADAAAGGFAWLNEKPNWTRFAALAGAM